MSKKEPPAISEIFETCDELNLGLLRFWKSKGLEISWDNFSDQVFLLSCDLAACLGIPHERFLANIAVLPNAKIFFSRAIV